MRWATFPSIAVGWTFSDEKFMKPFYWLSFGKIRRAGVFPVRNSVNVICPRDYCLLMEPPFMGYSHVPGYKRRSY